MEQEFTKRPAPRRREILEEGFTMKRSGLWRGTSLLLTLAMLACALLPTGVLAAAKDEQHFPDVGADYVLYDAVEWGAIHGIISGYADGNFYPGNALTSGAFAKMVAETFWLAEPGQTIMSTEQEENFGSHISFIMETADSEGTRTTELEAVLNHPNNVATRRNAITVLAALTDATNTDDQDLQTFPDIDESLAKQISAINGGPLKGEVISGFEDGTLRPDEPLTRGQGIALCAQYYAVHLGPQTIEENAGPTNHADNTTGNPTDDTANDPEYNTIWSWESQKTPMLLANQMAETGFETVEITLEVGGELDGEIRVSGILPTEQGIFVLTFFVTDTSGADKSGSYCWAFDGDAVGDILPLATVGAAIEVINAGPPDLDAIDFPEGEDWPPDDGWLPDGDWSEWFFPGNAVIDYHQVCRV